MTAAPVKKMSGTMADAAYEKTKQMILSNRLAPGQKLIYADLSEKLNMSKTPIISALNRLASEQYVVLKPNAGYYVRPLTAEDVLEALQARRMLEYANLEAVVSAANEKDLADLEIIHEEYCRSLDEYFNIEHLRLNGNFHLALARIGKNQFLIRFIEYMNEWLGLRLHFIFPNYLSQLRAQEGARDHGLLMEAVRFKDLEQARAIIERHLQRPIDFIQRNMSESDEI